MPEVVNISVGSLPGTSDDDATMVWPFGGKEIQEGLADIGNGECGVMGSSSRTRMLRQDCTAKKQANWAF